MQATTSFTSRKALVTSAAIIAALAVGTTIAVTTATAAPSSTSGFSLPTADELNDRIDAGIPVITDHGTTIESAAHATETVIEDAIDLYLRSDGIADENARGLLLSSIESSKQGVEDAHVLHLRILWALERYENRRDGLDDFGLLDLAGQVERLVKAGDEFVAPDTSDLATASAAVTASLTAALPATATEGVRLERLSFSLPFTVEKIVMSNGCGFQNPDSWGCYDIRDGGGVIRITENGMALSDGELRAIIAHEQRHHQQLEASVFSFSGADLNNRDWTEGDAYQFGDRYNPDL